MGKTPVYFILKENSRFRNLWIGTTGRSLGAWIYRVTLLTYAVHTLPHGVGIAWILLASGVPAVIMSPWMGPWIDRVNKRLMVIGGNLLLSAIAFTLFGIVYFGHSIFLVFALIILLSAGGGFPRVAGQSLTTQIVSRDQLPQVNGLNGLTNGAIMLIGALLGGAIVTWTSVAVGFLVTAISYVWYALWVMTLPAPEKVAVSSVDQKTFRYFTEFREGIHIARRNPAVLLVLGLGISWGIIGGSYYVLLSDVGSGALAANGTGIGIFYAIDGLGSMIGGGIAGQWLGRHDKVSRIAIIGAYFLQSVFLVFFARSSQLGLAIFWLLIMRIASGIVVTLDGLLLQLHVPQQYQGRVIALHGGLYGILMQGSYLVGGWGITALGAPMLGTLLAGLSAVIGLFVVLLALRMGLLYEVASTRVDQQV